MNLLVRPALFFVPVLIAAPAWSAQRAPVPVSPGGDTEFATIADRCPTFSWTAVASARALELAVYRLPRPATAGDDPQPVLRVTLPGAAHAWTPSLERCLEPGRYAWALRAQGPRELSAWSPPALFEVRGPTEDAEFRDALAVVRSYLAATAAGAQPETPAARYAGTGQRASGGEASGGAPATGAIIPLVTYGLWAESPAVSGLSHGIAGVGRSASGAGVVAENEAGGADLVLKGNGHAPDAVLSETGLACTSASEVTFNFHNPGLGAMRLQADGVDLVTELTDRDTLGALTCSSDQVPKWKGLWACGTDSNTTYSAGNQLTKTGTTFHVQEGAGSDLDADLLDGSEASAFASAGHGHFGETWSGAATHGLKVENSADFYALWGQATSNSGVGVYGFATSPVGATRGVFGKSSSEKGYGVMGYATATTGDARGVYGRSDSKDGAGVYGYATWTGEEQEYPVGVFGRADGTYGRGVYGLAQGLAAGVVGHGSTGDDPGSYGDGGAGVSGSGETGVEGYTKSNYGRGVSGRTSLTKGHQVAIYGEAAHGSDWAGFFVGDVHVSGTLSKSGGSFKIDHPLDPANRYLYHSFVESPDMMNVYNGNATLDGRGEAWVGLPRWFEALNREFRYQLTALGGGMPGLHVADEIAGNRFRIAGGTPGGRVSWQVTGIRQDAWAEAHRVTVEEDKPADEIGTYLHPVELGLTEELSLEHRKHGPRDQPPEVVAPRGSGG